MPVLTGPKPKKLVDTRRVGVYSRRSYPLTFWAAAHEVSDVATPQPLCPVLNLEAHRRSLVCSALSSISKLTAGVRLLRPVHNREGAAQVWLHLPASPHAASKAAVVRRTAVVRRITAFRLFVVGFSGVITDLDFLY
jgi:hypothetical protein